MDLTSPLLLSVQYIPVANHVPLCSSMNFFPGFPDDNKKIFSPKHHTFGNQWMFLKIVIFISSDIYFAYGIVKLSSAVTEFWFDAQH